MSSRVLFRMPVRLTRALGVVKAWLLESNTVISSRYRGSRVDAKAYDSTKSMPISGASRPPDCKARSGS